MESVFGFVNSVKKPFYITTTLPYVNAEPHLGFALELVLADIIARHKMSIGEEVFFNTGTDEHGIKIYEKAKKVSKSPKEYTDEYAEKFKKLKDPLGLLSGLRFIRTTDESHMVAAQEFWRRCERSGDIYKKNYRIKYCVGCELEKTDSELVGGRCQIHPASELQIFEEENYFFRLSKYEDALLRFYESRDDFIVPSFRLNEILVLIREKGLEDFSISRLKTKMPWGIPVPGDDAQVMYVWFDALINYVSTLGWPGDADSFKKWWIESGGVVQLAGKDQIRQQAVMWQAMLFSAGLTPSKQIVIHGFITSNGEKMSKSIGNVVDPLSIIREYGTDALRYYLARHIHPFEDSDFTLLKFKDAYNANLANGLGNLVSRILKMSSVNGFSYADRLKWGVEFEIDLVSRDKFNERVEKAWAEYNIQEVMNCIWEKISALDLYIQKEQPFRLIKERPDAGRVGIMFLLIELKGIVSLLEPFMPETAAKIGQLLLENKMPDAPLFPRR